ncbi:MAG TPA: hypothetical protein DCQ26_13380 [Marinilabiliales bacterium]|nr:MAG: hypothetical protein A2W96_15950 [Bacteroidetes bacterium GWD2_40_43]OFX89654.1 MAG: hypothetical protein A2W97_13050 [Bacteroidetes bacterium GWE2_40_63]OFY24172.1 MAG: hypothetical protein A2W88_14485 [Bacteroidetes bacterium GWF2_40_13]OFZ26364.1 MAG: hypothetical protein A2437_03400 [Bacteroidetes bacterium RIFOXYC2_FULL_40_12]HAM99595.1 hypothetical protein [Marinilabiliales bacterium]
MKINILKKKSTSLSLFILWLLLLNVAPFAFFVLSWHPYKFLSFGLLFLIFILILSKKKITILYKELYVILIIQIIFYGFYFVLHRDFAYVNLIIQDVSIILVSIFILIYFGYERFIESYVFLMKVMVVLGVLVFFYALFGGRYFDTFKYIDGRNVYNYLISFGRSPFEVGNGTLIRISGFFDEPGTFGFFLIQAILLNKIYFNNRRNEIILIVGGFFTLSVAFYISLFLFFLLFYFSYRRLMYLFISLFLFIILFQFLENNKNKSETYFKIHAQTIGRIEGLYNNKEKGEVIANNRKQLAERALIAFKDAPLFGHGITTVNPKYGYFGANILGTLANHGILGVFFVFMPFLMVFIISLFIKTSTFGINEIFKACLILLVNYLQRPDVTGLLIVTLLISFYLKGKELYVNNLNSGNIDE